MMPTIEIGESPFPYAVEEYEGWCRSDPSVIASLTTRSGWLGRSSSTYANQTELGQNYPEVRYAVHLIEQERFPRAGIVYENYTLSYERLQTLLTSHGLRALGVKHLCDVVSSTFFQEFDRLYDLNAADLTRKRADLLVDLCAVDPVRRRLLFAEVKKYNRGARRTEPFGRDQQLALAFLRHIFRSLGEGCFREGSWSAMAELVAFVAQEDYDSGRLQPRTYIVDYVA